MNIDSIYFKGHLCFQKEWAGFDTIKPINIIIGRNNSGKSHLLDLVEALCSKDKIDSQSWQYRCSGVLDEELLRIGFREDHRGGGLGGNHWLEHGQYFVNIPITWEVGTNGDISNEVFPDDFNLNSPYGESSTNARLLLIRQLLQNTTHPFNEHSFRRLLADRDIKTEPATVKLTLGPDGNGASNIIRRFILTANEEFPREVIQRELLKALNSIFGNDGQFSEIQVQHHDETPGEKQDHWEIYLGEDKKGLIPLSKSGSGLKTIILVLLNLLVVPKAKIEENSNKSDFVFAFEELENNLHPALLRRLFHYLEEYAINENAHIFLTTHSSTALDFFGVSQNAQIIHVVHDGESALVTPVSAHFDLLRVASGLGAKPSDLLQANGIVWVEGPSDRIYLNRWIDLYSEGRFQEGRDYQCAFYGGALLARTQFKAPEEAKTDLVNLLRVNPNIIVVCDGDRVSKDSEIKGRVKRIEMEVQKIPDAHIWITDAKEIENYIPGSVLEQTLELSELRDPEQYENFFPRKKACSESYIEANLNWRNIDKVDLAMSSVQYMENGIMAKRFDWEEQMKEVVARIKSWNS